MRLLKRMTGMLLVLCMIVSVAPMTVTATGTDPMQNVEGRLMVDAATEQDTVWIDGIEYAVQSSDGRRYIDLPADARPHSMVTYTYHVGDPDDVHTQYPVGMQVWALKENADGSFTPEKVDALDNILQYSGSSIRIVGNKGIRMITSIEQNKKNALVSGDLDGYKLLEYGTVLAWSSNLEGGNPLVLGPDYAKYNYAYKKGLADPVFAYSGSLMQYTNVLVGFDLDECSDDIAMRPYMILETPDGEEMTVYGGIVQRSIGYIAWQNKDVFTPGSAAHNYVWEIIRHVYAELAFETNGGPAVDSCFVYKGNVPVKPADPERDGYTFEGWFKDETLTEVFDFTAAISENVTAYAKWKADRPERPENLPAEEAYFWDNAEVLEVIKANESEDVPNEAEVDSLLTGRGFADYPIVYDFAIDGSYVDSTEVSAGSSAKHPVYYTYYRTQNDDIWIIYAINDSVMAYPLTYNMESVRASELIISESESITSYVDGSNTYYVTIPRESMMIVKVVDRIDANTLEQLTNAAIDALT